ncbi:Dynein light chain 4, axonemal [Cichlidogyrus casuarinus]|uniref:Dynein light chain n=1 Tax=Cichlidogyrus casuarinus TaxID=1844966 RepID=A0ABD2Q2B8_9PLAT
MTDEATGDKKCFEEPKRIHTYPLCKYSDMGEELRTEVMELVVTACEKYSANNEAAARVVKETLDKKFGSAWHVVVGEGFGFEITHETKNILYMYFGGNLAVVIWKCS